MTTKEAAKSAAIYYGKKLIFQRWLIIGLAVLVALSLIPMLIVVGMGQSAPASAATCAPGLVSTVAVPNLTPEQANNAAAIISVGEQMRMPTNGMIIAVAAARQESVLYDLANSNVPESLTIPHQGVGSDHDSVGLFQQRANWGSVAMRMDPQSSSFLFYTALLKVPNWQTLPLTVAAQAVQGSATPSAYQQWETLATQVVSMITKNGSTIGQCLAMPTVTATGIVRLVIMHAMQALGTLYDFGGSCTDPTSTNMSLHCDCSSLVMTAWGAAGVILPRTSEEQILSPRVHLVPGVTAANVAVMAQPGDLIFYNPGENGVPGPGHVALAVGGGKLIEAPQPGEVVHVIPIYGTSFVGLGRIA